MPGRWSKDLHHCRGHSPSPLSSWPYRSISSLWLCQNSHWNWLFIARFFPLNMVIFQFVMLNYQGVVLLYHHLTITVFHLFQSAANCRRNCRRNCCRSGRLRLPSRRISARSSKILQLPWWHSILLVGGLEHEFLYFHILGMLSSQLTNFFRGVETTNQINSDDSKTTSMILKASTYCSKMIISFFPIVMTVRMLTYANDHRCAINHLQFHHK